MAFLSLRDIRKSYFLGKEESPVLKGIDLDFELGEFVSILGESGGGKSTLMNIIGGLDREFEGEVTHDGQVLDHKQEKQLDAYRRGTIGYIYQAYNLITHLTVLDNVMVSLEMTTLNHQQRVERATELLEQVGLGDQIKKHPNQLSGGQKQRVAIARALAADPQIIIADEPTGALDSQNTAEVLTILEEIARTGKLVIAVTHSQEVANHGTRIVHLADGKIDGDERLRDAYPISDQQTEIPDRPLKASASYENAFKHLRYTFGRNSLIMIGVAIGLFAVMLFSGLGNGIKAYISDQVDSLANPTAVTVQRHQPQGQSGAQAGASGANSLFTEQQINKLKNLDNVDGLQDGYALANAQGKLDTHTFALNNTSTWSASYQTKIIKAGTKPGKNEIVVDKKSVAEAYSNNWRSIVGKEINVSWVALGDNGQPVPVTREMKVAGVADFGHNITTNLTTAETVKAAHQAAGASAKPQFVTIKIDTVDNVKHVADKVDAMKDSNGKRLFSAITIGSILSTINTIVSLATTVLAAIAGISLVVSALMIIVTMYMSVSERTKEIGILRALGESKRDIRRIFTAESLLIGVFSFILALILAFVIGAILNHVLYGIAHFTMIRFTLTNIIGTLILALIISYVAALLPARRAARLNPISALSAD